MATIIICRTCGRELELPAGKNILTCPACSTSNSRPQAQGPTLEKLNRATRLRQAKNYALAEQCYNAVLAEYDNEHEALWGRLLCHYGVEIIQDAPDGRRYPLVHIPRRAMMQESADFLHACELAPPEIRRQYEEDAAYVDEVLADIHITAETCPPYDVFLCHKTTRLDSKEKTEDYDRAFQIYHGLDKQGYRVFFAPMELQGKSGANYEAGIYHALHTARAMLVICSDPEYISSTWVQSEWQRYLEQMAREDDPTPRTLRPLLYGGMQPSQLPREFLRRKLQAITMEGYNAHDNLMAVLEQYCGKRGARGPFTTAAAEDGLCITGYSGPGGQVDIPASIDGRKVVEIGENAFRDNASILSVSIPEGVTRVASAAFWRCPALISLQLPASLNSIANGAFGACTALRSLLLAPDNPRYRLRDNTLYTREGALVCHPAGLLAESFDVPENTIAVWQNAFAGCIGLRRVTFPDTVRFIAQDAFHGCIGLTLRAQEGSPAHKHALQNNLRFEPFSALPPDSAFITAPVPGGIAVTGYTGPGGDVQLPRGVTHISEKAFRGCRTLTRIILPEGVTHLGSQAFMDCTSLQSVQLPASLTHIGHNPFTGCTALKSIAVSAGNQMYCTRSNVLLSRSGTLLSYPPSLNAATYAIPDTVSSIGAQAFAGCTSLTSVTIPPRVADLGEQAFEGCDGLTLLVQKDSPAHRYAQGCGLRFQLPGGSTTGSTTSSDSGSQLNPNAVTLRIKRSAVANYASRKVCIRVNGKELCQLGNGEGVTLRVSPGRHVIDVKFKPAVGNVNWDARGGLRNIYPTQMLPGQTYIIDVADFIRQLS